MKNKLLIPVMLLLVIFAHPGFADGVDDGGLPNDPNVNDRANACYDGGTLEDQCGTTDVNGDKEINEQDIEWMWTAGWYLIRYEYGLISMEAFPESYIGIVGSSDTCMLILNDAVQAQLGLSDPRIKIFLTVLHEGSNSTIDPLSYRFKWMIILHNDFAKYRLQLITSASRVNILNYDANYDGELLRVEWLDKIISNTCPNPTAF